MVSSPKESALKDLFKSRDVLKVGKQEYVIFRLDALEKAGLVKLSKLPYSIRVVLEARLWNSRLRCC
jgi:aconitate hydratase